MEMVQVNNRKIIQHGLPRVGKLKDGRTVAGYHLLDEEILKDEGWLPLEDVIPEYDFETQQIVPNGYEILEDKVIKKYKIENILESNSEIDVLKERLNSTENALIELLMEV